MNEDYKNEIQENTNKKIKDINENITFFNKKNFALKLTNIRKEIKKRNSDLRKYFNIKNTIFKDMQLKQNSLIYKEFIKHMGKYYFGPHGKISEKYKFLKDYYEEKDLKMGLNNKICAGTLDYFSLLSNYDSYSQRINSTKEKMLFSSNNLSVARSGFDMINQNAMNHNKLFNKNKNFVKINKKNIKNYYNNNSKKHMNSRNNIVRKIVKKVKINIGEIDQLNKLNIDIKSVKSNDSTLINEINTKTQRTNDLSYKSVSPKKTILEKYSNESIIKELKRKLNYINNYPLSNSHNKINFCEKNKNIKLLKEFDIKNNLSQKIKPILFLNRNSIMDLSFIKKNQIKSKNERNAKRLIMKRNMSEMYDALYNESDLTKSNQSELPTLQSITLSKRKEKLKNKKCFVFDNN